MVEKNLRHHLEEFQVSRLLIQEEPFEVTSTSKEHLICENVEFNNECQCSSDYSLGACDCCLRNLNTWEKATWQDQDDDNNANHAVDDSGLVDLSTLEIEANDRVASAPRCYVLINGRLFYAPASRNRSDLLFVYIGKPGPTLTSMTLKWPQCSFYVVHPWTGKVVDTNAAKIVMQRNYKIEQIKDAQKIGILISNYNLPGFHELFDRLSCLIKRAGKTPFVQYSAHPDLPKLVNIPNIDVFVYIACPESTVIEREVDPDLYKMLATPWELEVALNPNRSWGLNFETNSLELLKGGCSYKPLSDSEFDPQIVSVSLLSNRTQSIGFGGTAEVASPHLDSKTGALLEVGAQQLQKVIEGHSKGLLWGETAWRGLDPNAVGQDAPPLGTVVQGKKGIAGGYANEGL